jgi:hypothetical protein
MKNTMASSMANTQKAAALPAAMGRERNRRSGTMGSGARSSHATKATASTIPAASAAAISGLRQPRPLARISAQTMPRAPPVARIRPTGSRLARARSAAGILARISGIMIRPIGTFNQKIHGQVRPCVTAPPTTGPASTAIPVTLLNIPSAQARRCGGNAADSRASASGSISAAPAPWTARAATSAAASGARAHAAEAAVNRPTPTASIRRRPSRSPSAAPVSSSTAKLSV